MNLEHLFFNGVCIYYF